MFVCPRCTRRLVRTKSSQGFFFVCPGCQGRAAGLSVVRRAAGRNVSKAIWSEAIRKDGHSGARCPVCERKMVEVPVPVQQHRVYLDVCIGCQFVWFDAHELEQLPRPETAPEQKPLPARAREEIALAEIESVAQQAELEGDSYGGPSDPWKWAVGLFGLPVECSTPSLGSAAWVTWGLAASLVAVFFLTADNLAAIVPRYGFVPAEPLRLGGLTLITSFFLHAGIWYLVGNAYFPGRVWRQCRGRPGPMASSIAVGGGNARGGVGSHGRRSALGDSLHRGQRRNLRDHHLLRPEIPYWPLRSQ